MGADQVDWGRIRAKPGDWCCDRHGIITPVRGDVVPYCPRCRRIALEAVVTKGGVLLYRQPEPSHCGSLMRSGRDGTVNVWTCPRCGEEKRWPPTG